MSKIESLEDIETIKVHWSESLIVNEALGMDSNCNIEKLVSVEEFKHLLTSAASKIRCGFDKISLTITLKGGFVWCLESKFYICGDDADLLDFINKGQ